MVTHPFTERELEIIALLAEDLTNSEMAARLHLSAATVKWYIRQINAKLNTDNRKDIVAKASRLGLLNGNTAHISPPTYNLPHQAAPFIGREEELRELNALLSRDNVRLLTILAPGGMGKTRLALEAAGHQFDRFRDGVYFVPLQPIFDGSKIPAQIAMATGYPMQSDGRDEPQQILDFLTNKHMLLVLDNFDQLLDSATYLAQILIAAPDVKLLVTSREKLNLGIEVVYFLKGMRYPGRETVQDAMDYDAAKLLIQAAKRAKPDWEITPQNLMVVARICKLTQGMPLAILLAVGWLDMLTIEQIYSEIQKSADILETEQRDMPERQRSVYTVFETTWKRLTATEKTIFMRMSVFRGGCTVRAAEHITGANLRTLQGLVNKALLSRTQDDRIEIHELLRQYAGDELERSGDYESVRSAHMHYYAEAMRAREKTFHDHRMPETMQDVSIDLENVKQALEWALMLKDKESILNIIISIYWYFMYFDGGSSFLPFREQVKKILKETQTPVEKHIQFYIHLSGFFFEDFAYMQKAVQECEKIADELDNDQLRGIAMFNKIMTFGTPQERIAHALKILPFLEEKRLAYLECITHVQLTINHFHLLDYERAKDHALKMLELSQKLGNPNAMQIAFSNVGTVYFIDRAIEKAITYQKQSLEIALKHKLAGAIIDGYIILAFSWIESGDFEEAERLFLEALTYVLYLNHSGYEEQVLYHLASFYLMQQDIPKAQEMLQRVLSIAQVKKPFIGIVTETEFLIHQGKYLEALSGLSEYYAPLLTDKRFIPTVELLVPYVSLLTFYFDRLKQALEICALIDSNPLNYGWKHFPSRKKALDHIREHLTPDAYGVAYERGKSLNVGEVFKQLVDEFA